MTNDNFNDQSTKELIKYILFTFIFISISILTFIGIYKFISDQSLFLSLKIFSRAALLKVLGLMVIYYLVDALRLFYVLKAIGVKTKFLFIFKIVFINIFVSNITPFATGGGFAQIYFLNKKGISIGDASAASLIRTVIPIIFFIMTVPIIIIFDINFLNIFPNKFPSTLMVFFISLYILVIYLGYEMIKNPEMIENIIHKFLTFLRKKKIIKREETYNHYKSKIDKEIEKLSSNIKNYLKGEKKYVILSLFFSIMFLFVLFYFSVLLIKELNANVSTIKIILSQLLITFMMYFAPTPGASGVAEGSFTLMFSRYVNMKSIVSLTFAWRLFSIYIAMIIGMILFYYHFYKDIKMKKRRI